ncbi:MAG TPA: HD domain-containing protein [Candidatus Bathyarchaeia archaeon]|nr:HD domain-containing protein [Candidatus Bathyarchaeia archaeon]
MIFDRLYGRLSFPHVVGLLLTCPGLLRLREIRIANVPFLAFPSFSNCNRYEHSIGACHLAGLTAKTLDLTAKDKIELMTAGLYHDVATPPFGHAVEGVLKAEFGYDHEQHLYDLLTGRTSDLGREMAQIFLGRSLKLQKVCQTPEARQLGLDPFRIADLALGKTRLGSLLKSTVDLDNIDNIIRASTAMGLEKGDGRLAELLAMSFVIVGEEIQFSEKAFENLSRWRRLRERVYTCIYDDVQDFSLQAMIKHAVRVLVHSENVPKLREEDWCLTEEELLHNRLMQNPDTKRIATRIRLGDTFTCLGMFSLSSWDIDNVRKTAIPQLEDSSEKFFGFRIIADYFLDRRWRTREIQTLHQPLMTFEENLKPHQIQPNVIVGIFTEERINKVKRLCKNRDFASWVLSSIPSGTDVHFMRTLLERTGGRF